MLYCFEEAADAQKFMERFGGEKFDPIERGRGRPRTHREGDHFHFSQQIFILSRGRGSPPGQRMNNFLPG